MNKDEYNLTFEREGSNAYFRISHPAQTPLPGIKDIRDSFAWELGKRVSNTSTDTVSIIEEEKAFMVNLKDLPIVRAITVDYRGDYKIYGVIINYNDPEQEMEMLEKLNEIYDELGNGNIVIEYDPVPDRDLERTLKKGIKILMD